MTVSKKLERLLQKNPELTLAQAKRMLGDVSKSMFYKVKGQYVQAAVVPVGTITTNSPAVVVRASAWKVHKNKKSVRATPANTVGSVTLDEIDSTRKLVNSMGQDRLTGLIKRLASNDARVQFVDG